jgi:hypothetical protein
MKDVVAKRLTEFPQRPGAQPGSPRVNAVGIIRNYSLMDSEGHTRQGEEKMKGWKVGDESKRLLMAEVHLCMLRCDGRNLI